MLKVKSALSVLFLSFFLLETCGQYVDNLKLIPIGTPGSCDNYYSSKFSIEGGRTIDTLTLPHLKWNSSVKVKILKPRGNVGEETEVSSLTPAGNQKLMTDLNEGKPTDFVLKLPSKFLLYKVFIDDSEICSAFSAINDNFVATTLQYDIQDNYETLPKSKRSLVETPLPANNSNSCGLSDIESSGKGNRVAKPGEHPWLTVIYRKREDGTRFHCFGSLISAKLILSVAHCYHGRNLAPNDIVASLGQYNLSDYTENSIVNRSIESLIIHPEYKKDSSSSIDADLALLQMHDAVSFSTFIKPICLWNGPTDEESIAGNVATVVYNNFADTGIRNVQTISEVNVVSELICLSSSPAFLKIITSRTLCAGNRDGTGPTHGTSGAGLMLNRNGTWMLRGVLAVGLIRGGEVDLNEYQLYSDVAKYLPWIQIYIGESVEGGSSNAA